MFASFRGGGRITTNRPLKNQRAENFRGTTSIYLSLAAAASSGTSIPYRVNGRTRHGLLCSACGSARCIHFRSCCAVPPPDTLCEPIPKTTCPASLPFTLYIQCMYFITLRCACQVAFITKSIACCVVLFVHFSEKKRERSIFLHLFLKFTINT